MAIEFAYVIDTHALLWYLTGNSKLSQTAKAIFDAAERGETQLYISVIVLAELYFLNKKWAYLPDFFATYQTISTNSMFYIVDFFAEDLAQFDADAVVTEMHDRIIAGLAIRLKVPLVTADSQITSANLVQVVW